MGSFTVWLWRDYLILIFSVFGSVVRSTNEFIPVPVVVLELLFDFCLLVIITRLRRERVVVKESVLIGGLFYLSTSATWSLANAATFTMRPHTVTIVDLHLAFHFRFIGRLDHCCSFQPAV